MFKPDFSVLRDLPTADSAWKETFSQDFPEYVPGPDQSCLGCNVHRLRSRPLYVTAGLAVVRNVVERGDGSPVEVPNWLTVFDANHAGRRVGAFVLDEAFEWVERNVGRIDTTTENHTPEGGQRIKHPHGHFLLRSALDETDTRVESLGLPTLILEELSRAGKVANP